MPRFRAVLKALLALVYLVAGIMHLVALDGFVQIVPPWVPWPRTVVVVTGVLEMAAAFALYVPRLERTAGLALAAYAVCVYPANVHHALHDIPAGGVALGWGYHGPRLAFQPVLVWWALFAVRLVHWPFGPSDRRPT